MSKRKFRIAEQLEYRKPKRVKSVICFASSSNEMFAVCPTCKSLLDREYMGYCDVCGQKLSWQDFEDAEIIYK